MAVILENGKAKLIKDQTGKYIWRLEFKLSQVFDTESQAVTAMNEKKITWRDMQSK